MQTIKSQALFNLSILLLLGLIWGTGYSIARFATTNGVHPIGYSLWQSIGPAIVFSFIMLFKGEHLPFSFYHIGFYLVCGLTGIVIPNTAMYFAAPHLPASILALVVNTVPIIAYPLALIAGLETFKWQRLIGILLAFLGLILIILPKSSLPTPTMAPWVLSTLIAPLSFAFCSIFIARYKPMQSSILSMTTGMLIFSSILLIPLVFYTGSFYPLHSPLNLPDYIVLLEIFLSSIGYLLFFYLIKIAGPVYYSLVDTIVVLTGLFWGRLIFSEQLNKWTGLAVCFIIAALLLVTRKQKTSPNTSQNDYD